MSIGLYFFKSEVTLLLFGRCMFKGGRGAVHEGVSLLGVCLGVWREPIRNLLTDMSISARVVASDTILVFVLFLSERTTPSA